MTYKVNDRVVLQSQLKTHFGVIDAGTICTVMSEPKGNEKDEILILRSGFDEGTNRPVLLGAAESLLRIANEEEIKQADYKNLVSRAFWIGEKYSVGRTTQFDNVGPGEVGTIKDIKLRVNESSDLITFSFDKGQHKFERTFVEVYMDKYDEELEKMYGDEMVLKDMPRNYFLPGARMILDNREFVILSHSLPTDENIFIVEDMAQNELEVEKDRLQPILSTEQFMSYSEEDVVQGDFRTGRQFIANEDIARHALLKGKIKQDDVLEILHNNGININAFEDTFKVVINEDFRNAFDLSYMDLKLFFKPHNLADVEAVEEQEEVLIDEQDFEVFGPVKQEVIEEKEEVLGESEQEEISVRIMDAVIHGFRFKFNEEDFNRFSIDSQEKEYNIDEIDKMITALQKLKEMR